MSKRKICSQSLKTKTRSVKKKPIQKKQKVAYNQVFIKSLESSLQKKDITPCKKEHDLRFLTDDESKWNVNSLLSLGRPEKTSFATFVGDKFYRQFCQGTFYMNRSSNDAIDEAFKVAVLEAPPSYLKSKWKEYHLQQNKVYEAINQEKFKQKNLQWLAFGKKVIQLVQDLLLLKKIYVVKKFSRDTGRLINFKKQFVTYNPPACKFLIMMVDCKTCAQKLSKGGKQYSIFLKSHLKSQDLQTLDTGNTNYRLLVQEGKKIGKIFYRCLQQEGQSKKWLETACFPLDFEKIHLMAQILNELKETFFDVLADLIWEFFYEMDALKADLEE